jgi:hypothetical protein
MVTADSWGMATLPKVKRTLRRSFTFWFWTNSLKDVRDVHQVKQGDVGREQPVRVSE